MKKNENFAKKKFVIQKSQLIHIKAGGNEDSGKANETMELAVEKVERA